jgi:hypothetical protein
MSWCTENVFAIKTQQFQTFPRCTLFCLQWLYSKCMRCPKKNGFTQAQTTTALYHACFAVPCARTVNHMELCWNCFAIMNSAVSNFLVLDLVRFAVTDSTVFCYVACLMHGLSDPGSCDHILSAFIVNKCNVCTENTATTASRLVMFYARLASQKNHHCSFENGGETHDFLWVSLNIIHEYIQHILSVGVVFT